MLPNVLDSLETLNKVFGSGVADVSCHDGSVFGRCASLFRFACYSAKDKRDLARSICGKRGGSIFSQFFRLSRFFQ